jgi:hypothetical protein
MLASHVGECLVERLVVEEPFHQRVIGLGAVDNDTFQVLVEDLAELVDVVNQPGLSNHGVFRDAVTCCTAHTWSAVPRSRP